MLKRSRVNVTEISLLPGPMSGNGTEYVPSLKGKGWKVWSYDTWILPAPP